MPRVSYFTSTAGLLLAVFAAGPQAIAAAPTGGGFHSRCKVPDFAALVVKDRAKAKVEAEALMRCINAEARQQGLQRAKPVCLSKGLRDNTPDMKRCQTEVAHATCLRSIGEYEALAGQVGSSSAGHPTAASTCAQIYY
jgi:hypothetical protein